MYHFLYATTNRINGKIYVGKHSTENLNDGYKGSGTVLQRAFKKHGIENFDTKILEFCSTEVELNDLERRVVNEDFINASNTYNLRIGGRGGFLPRDVSQRGGSISLKNRWRDLNWRNKQKKTIGERSRELHKTGVCKPPTWIGRKHKIETKRKIGIANSIHQQGENNSQFGTVWISNSQTQETKKISKNELDAYVLNGWHRGRKF